MARAGQIVVTTGLRELDAALGNLPNAVGRSVVRKVLIEAGDITASVARGLVPVDEHDLQESIEVSVRINRRQTALTVRESVMEVYVGPRSGKNEDPDGFYGHMVEFGTAAGERVGLTKKGRKVRQVHPGTAPQPFMRPAWDQTQDRVLAHIGVLMGDAIMKAVRRQERKLAKQRVRKG